MSATMLTPESTPADGDRLPALFVLGLVLVVILASVGTTLALVVNLSTA